MKRILTLIIVLAAALSAWPQDTNGDIEETVERKPVVLPGAGKINVENLNKFNNYNMDISKLSLAELRVLRNSFPARQGYIFMSGDLRSIFETTTWYSEKMWSHFEKDESTEGYGYQDDGSYKSIPIKYTPAETKFMAKLKARETELLKQNFKTTGSNRVNLNNIINPWQMENMDSRLSNALSKNGFAIVPNDYEQLFQIYENNDYHCFPNFVTTDLFLQLYHMYFDCVMREVEEKQLSVNIEQFCQQMYDEMKRLASSGTLKSKELQAAAEYNQTYYAIALALNNGKGLPEVPAAYKEMAQKEVQNVLDEQPNYSEFLEYQNLLFTYNLFRPRGHYTRTETLKRYFRAMMWLQTVPFGTDKDAQLRRALFMANTLGNNDKLKTLYNNVSDPITYLMGTPDNVTMMQVYEAICQTGQPLEKIVKDKKLFNQLRKTIEDIGEQQTRIRPKFEYSSHCKINLMPQRYMPDGEVLQEMVDYDNLPTKRDVPRGLDFFAALGNGAAERILLSELQEDKRWEGFKPMLAKMKQRMGEIDWNENVANKWMSALGTMTMAENNKYPYFMQTQQWDKKDLNAALASWAELKHDAILYAKQPAGAECGDYSAPDPVFKGYVEPNVAFWQKAIELLKSTEQVFRKYGLLTERAGQCTERIREEAEFLLNVSKKELAGQRISDEEYEQIRVIGATYENITLDLLKAEDQWLDGWSNVEGADKSVAVVADVYTANAKNNPSENRSVLYEAVGPAYNIYVVVEIDGMLYLTRGAVLSYREFKRALNAPRLTDEEWQESLKEKPNEGIPAWMKEIIVPLDNEPQDNETIFYSTGC
ncbi:MAG: DUF3160 domain-containing protein [Prevotella sp.]|nr:DUF3160 domain-containing protein [Prevotella sp.]